MRVGVGFYHAETAQLTAFREAVADDRTGARLRRILDKMVRQGWELGGETLKTTPRGYDADHPRIDLLRHKSLTLGKSYGFEPVIHTRRAARPGPVGLAAGQAVRRVGPRARHV